MHTTYRMSAADLDERFLASVKSLFGANEVEISICGPAQSEDDETSYLLKSEANRKHLLAALADVEAGRNLVAVKPEELAAMK